ncbi:glycine zipper domain-containing protein [Rubripirellula lacrimiformis]|nr:glycine zipper domain-containing protein [Rubripirellula lacrimiformis]
MIRRISLAALLATVTFSDSVTIPTAFAQDHLHRRRGAVLGGLAGAALGVAIGDKGNNETAGALIGGAVGAIAGGAIGDAQDQRIQHDRQYHSGYPLQAPAYGGAHQRQPSYNAPYPHAPHYNAPHSGHPAPYRSHHPYTSHQPSYYDAHYFAPSPYTEEVVVGSQANPYSVTITAPYRQSVPAGAQSQQPLSNRDVIALVNSGLSDAMVVRQINARGITRSLAVSEIIELHQQGVSETVIDAMQGVIAEAPAPFTSPAPAPLPEPLPAPAQRSYRTPTGSPDLYGNSIIQNGPNAPSASGLEKFDESWDDQGPTLTAPAFTGPGN